MKITGQILRENRERKGISVNEVAVATKINAKTITAMESGDVENLPPKTFLRGFVRAYATYLDLDVESLLNTFFEEMGSTKPKPPEVIPTTPRGNSDEADAAINPKTSMAVTIGAIAGILLLVVLIVFFKNKMESYEKEAVKATPPSGLETLPTASSSPIASGTPSNSTNLAAALKSSPSPAPAASPVLAAVAAATASATAAPTASPTPKPTASPTPKPTATATPKPTPASTPAPSASPTAAAAGAEAAASPSPSPTPKPAKTMEILIEALNTVEIAAKIDGSTKTISMQADQVQTIRAKKVSLQISDGGAVNLTVNGADRGVPGDLGKAKRVDLP